MIDVTFLENVPFSSPLTHTSQGEESDLLVYTLASPVVSPEPAHVKPPITQVYSWRQKPPALSPPPPASSSDPINRDDLLITLRKGKRQCAHSISSFCSYNCLPIPVLLLHPWTLFRCLTIFMKSCLTLVGLVL